MTARVSAGVLAAVSLAAGGWAMSAYGDPGMGAPVTVERTVTATTTVQALAGGHSAAFYRLRLRQRTRQRDHAILGLRHARQTIRHQTLLARRRYAPTVALAVAYAQAVYGIDQGHRVHCESTDNVYASNGSHFGILQFAPSTWRTTPFAGFSIYDPVAQALAGGWMVRAGRSGEWTCGL